MDRSSRQRSSSLLVGFVLVLGLVLTGCGGEQPDSDTGEPSLGEPEITSQPDDVPGEPGPSTDKEQWDPSRKPLPEPKTPQRVRVESTLDLGTRDETTEGSYTVTLHSDGSFLLEGEQRRGDRVTPVEFHWDPPNYRLVEDGQLTAAGEGNPFASVQDLLPGFETFIVPYYIGMNPLGLKAEDVQQEDNRYQGPHGSMVFEDGIPVETEGIPQLLNDRYQVYDVEVDYEETIQPQPVENPEASRPQVTEKHLNAMSTDTGTAVPDHKFVDLDGNTRKLSELDQPVLVNVWATWCAPCVHEIPELNDLHDEYGDRVAFVGLSSEETSTIREFQENEVNLDYHTWRYPGSVPEPFGAVAQLPNTFLLNEDRQIQYVVVGARDADFFEEKIQAHLLD